MVPDPMTRASSIGSPLIDSHCHLDFPDFDRDREEIVQWCRSHNIHHLILPGVTRSQWERSLHYSRHEPILHPAVGLHPLFLQQHEEGDLAALDALLERAPEIIAVGEIGLDHYLPDVDRSSQRSLFIRQLEIAHRHNRPLLLHVRKAHQEVIEILQKHDHHRGIVHAFSGSLEQAQQYIDMGFLVGVGGVATRPNAHKLHRTVRGIGLESIALESDAPDLPPIWAKGERNSPQHLPAIAHHIADLRGESVEQVALQTTSNVSQLFGL